MIFYFFIRLLSCQLEDNLVQKEQSEISSSWETYYSFQEQYPWSFIQLNSQMGSVMEAVKNNPGGSNKIEDQDSMNLNPNS